MLKKEINDIERRFIIQTENTNGRLNKKKPSYTSGIQAGKTLKVKQYLEGFTGLSCDDKKFDPQWMKDSGRKLALVNPKPPFTAPEQFNEAASKDRRRYKKKSINLWNSLIADNDDLQITNGNFKVQSKISQDIPRICREQSREEYYIPFAYLYDDRPVGGNFIHAWEAGTPKQLKQARDTIKNKPFKEFFTGGCLFGVPLYGMDQFGERHSLTNPYQEVPESSIIQNISCPYPIHPDEILTRESLVNIIHLIKAMGTEKPVLNYHLPLANYILYGINWFLKGRMSKKALAEYVDIVRKRVETQRSYLESVSNNFGMEINAASSLDLLGLDKVPADSVLEVLLSKLKIEASLLDDMPKDILCSVKAMIFTGIIDFMQEQDGKYGEIWRHIGNKIKDGAIDVSEFNLLTLNYLDYSANLASSAASHEERETASVLPSHESPVNHLYKKIFSEKTGPVTCFQWLAPLQVHDPELGVRAFHLENYIDDINELLKLGLIRKNFLQSAAAALYSDSMLEQISAQINEILTIHEQSIELRAKKEQLLVNSNESGLLHLNLNTFAS